MKLICKIEPFDYLQSVYMATTENSILKEIAQLPLNDLIAYVPEYCFSNNIDNVLLMGTPTIFAENSLKTPIEEYIAQNYNNKNLKIEVIEYV